jgi:hypothetical protein
MDFIGPINPPTRSTMNRYIITTTGYITKWVEAGALKNNTTKSTAKFHSEKNYYKIWMPIRICKHSRWPLYK